MVTGLLSLFSLSLISIGIFNLAKWLKIPYTVLLVLTGLCLVPLTRLPEFAFLDDFTLTPEILFYIFLPVLLFEAAYAISFRELMRNFRPILFLAVGGLFLSAVFVSFVLQGALGLIGMTVPFVVVLLFGALISATDPVAVLALFKEFGAPRRLALLFEGESLFNDGTAVAFFLIVLGVATYGFDGSTTLAEGVFAFTSMMVGGALFGIFMGYTFSKIVSWVHHEHLELTLTLLVAHLTFILAELISEHLEIAGHAIHVSAIVATVFAAVVIGNFGRPYLSFEVKQLIEPVWGYFAFLANSLVFLSMGILFAKLPVELHLFVLPVVLAIVVVVLGRAFSVYPLTFLFNLTAKREERIPSSWSHLLAWGSLRGALAIIMVLLIPDTLTVPGWEHPVSIKDFITALTIGCIYFTLFVKALTIGPMIRWFGLNKLTSVHEAQYHQGRIVILSYALERLEQLFGKGYIDQSAYVRTKEELEGARRQDYCSSEAHLKAHPEHFEYALRLLALDIEKHFLDLLFRYKEVCDRVYRRVLKKIEIQHDRVEEGQSQISSLHEKFAPDSIDRLDQVLRNIFGSPESEKRKREHAFMYYRAQMILARKVLKELEVFKESAELNIPEYHEVLKNVTSTYQGFYVRAEEQLSKVTQEDPEWIAKLSSRFGERSVYKLYAEGLEKLLEKEALAPKVELLLRKELLLGE